MEEIFSTEYILKTLEVAVSNKQPFSTVRLGDGYLGVLYKTFCDDFIENGKWSGKVGENLKNKILLQLTIAREMRSFVVKELSNSVNNATYCDSYDAYLTLNTNKKQLDIWVKIGKGYMNSLV